MSQETCAFCGKADVYMMDVHLEECEFAPKTLTEPPKAQECAKESDMLHKRVPRSDEWTDAERADAYDAEAGELAEKVAKLEAENEKLRKEAESWIVDRDSWMKRYEAEKAEKEKLNKAIEWGIHDLENGTALTDKGTKVVIGRLKEALGAKP